MIPGIGETFQSKRIRSRHGITWGGGDTEITETSDKVE